MLIRINPWCARISRGFELHDHLVDDAAPQAPPTVFQFSAGLHTARGLAAVVVVAFHCLLTFKVSGLGEPYHRPPFSGGPQLKLYSLLYTIFNGQACVTLFFVLSGAVLSMSLARNPFRRPTDLLAFYIKRAVRLYPLLVCATVFAALVFSRPWRDTGRTTVWIAWQHQTAVLSIQGFLANALALRTSFNAAAWSIRVELAGSFLFPALFWISRRRTPAVAVSAILILYLLWPHDPLRFGQTLEFLLAFVLGSVLIHVGHGAVRVTASWPARSRIVAMLLAVTVLLGSRRIVDQWGSIPYRVILVETLASTLIVCLLLSSRPLSGPWERRFMSLGNLSFGIYLLHLPVLLALEPIVSNAASGMGWLASSAILFLTTLSLALATSWCAHRWIERPCNSVGRWFSGRLRNLEMAERAAEDSA